jgi:LysM repeat protein
MRTDAADHIQQQDPGDASGEAIPVPIPNTEVKLSSAEDTERAAFRENRSSPGSCAFRGIRLAMLVAMNMADADPPRADPPRADPALRSTAPAAEAVAEHATPRGCPFLLAESGGWRLDLPSRDHRCAAFVPPAPLSPEKQTRLCLTAEHTACPTYVASLAARTARLGSTPGDRATRWGLARTTTVIQDPGGVRAWLLGAALDRRRWPAIPAVLLVTALATLAVSGFGADPSSAVATASPNAPTPPVSTRAAPTAAPATSAQTAAPASATPAATAARTPVPTSAEPTLRTHTVRNGDTLSAIAARYDTTVAAIVNLNDLNNANNLRVGQVLLIPN